VCWYCNELYCIHKLRLLSSYGPCKKMKWGLFDFIRRRDSWGPYKLCALSWKILLAVVLQQRKSCTSLYIFWLYEVGLFINAYKHHRTLFFIHAPPPFMTPELGRNLVQSFITPASSLKLDSINIAFTSHPMRVRLNQTPRQCPCTACMHTVRTNHIRCCTLTRMNEQGARWPRANQPN
jgi:hypothetical protein